jgi:hypothetical protein
MSDELAKLQQLPYHDQKRVFELIAELYSKMEENIVSEAIAHYTSKSAAFDVIRDDEEIYTLDDLKVKFRDE